MLKLLVLSLSQSLLLALGQVFLKLATAYAGEFVKSWKYFLSWLYNPWFALCGICMGAASILWFYILKHYDFSLCYPLISFSYVFGMILAVLVFGESVSLWRWFGLCFIVLGTFLLLKQ